MGLLDRIRSAARESRGSVLVLVALFAPVAVLLCAFVIDIGNGWWHQRHLQVQADAAALAAADDLSGCGSSPATANSLATSAAQTYGGVGGTSPFNVQVGGAHSGSVYQRINQPNFQGQPAVDSTFAGGYVSPCDAQMVDVKMTETNLPFFLPVFKSVLNVFPFINAQARVELKELTTVNAGQLPVAVNDVKFRYAEAYFINENTGTQLVPGGVALQENPTASNGLDVWSNAAAPYSLTVPADPGATGTPPNLTYPDADVGVRIALAGSVAPTNNMATTCAAAGTMCFDDSSPNAQLLDVHGYSTTGNGSPTAPVNHGVIMTPTPGGCDQYYTVATSTCNDGLQATLDLGNNLNGVVVNAVVGGTTYTLTCPNPTGNPKLTTCTTNGYPIPIAAGSGRSSVGLQVVYTQGQGKNKTVTTTTIQNAQSTYAGSGASNTSGPIQAATLSVGGTSDTSALAEGTPTPVVVTLGITPSISVAQPTDPPITMRFDGVGSQNQSVTCTPVTTPQNFDAWGASLATGCQGPYQVNQALSCPDTNTPVDCAPPATGNQTNKVAKALNYRILGSTSPTACTAPNHWPNYQPGDPRIVSVFITPYNSFSGSGSSTSFPIQDFAAFYVTGWAAQGQGNNNPCQGNGDDTAPAGTMVGHFIHYVQPPSNGSGGTQTCAPNSLSECVAVMTR
jgi:Flp pilus assembly protein TadG